MPPFEQASSQTVSQKMSSRKSSKLADARTAEADLVQKSLAPDTADVEMVDMKMAPVTSCRPTGTTTTLPAAVAATTVSMPSVPSTESKPAQAENTSPRTKSSMTIPPRHPSAPSRAVTQVPPESSRQTTPVKIPETPGTPSESPITTLTNKLSAHMMMDTTSSTAHEVGNNIMQPQTPVQGSLHKRRASASPDKFSSTRLKHLKFSTGLKNLNSASPVSRGWTVNKTEIYYDSNGALHMGTQPKADPSVDSTGSFFSGNENHSQLSDHEASYQRLNAKQIARGRKKLFSLLESIIRDNSLLITLTSYLDVPSIISLYAISKSFHLSFNRHSTAFILSSMRTWAPNADIIFPWRCYITLCIGDPIKRQQAIPQAFEADINRLGDLSRRIPSLRWLQMVVWRHAICTDMLMQLSSKALRTPQGTLDAVQRMWFALDMPLSAHRLAIFRDKTYFSTIALLLANHFLIKCDMAFTDPGMASFPVNHPNQAMFPNQWAFGAPVGCNLREKLTAERNMTALWRVLKGLNWDMDEPPRPIERPDILRLNVRHKYRVHASTPGTTQDFAILGMRYSEFKFIGYERTYREDDDEATRLARPLRPLTPLHTLIMGEDIRRGLKLHTRYLEMITWGFALGGYRRAPVFTVNQQRAILRRPEGAQPKKKAALAMTLSEITEILGNMGEADDASMGNNVG